MINPCMNCELKGCGAYHDKCPEYKMWCTERHKMSEVRKNNYTNSKEILSTYIYTRRGNKK